MDKFLKPKEAAELLNITETKLDELTKLNKIPHLRVTKKIIRYDKDDLLFTLKKSANSSKSTNYRKKRPPYIRSKLFRQYLTAREIDEIFIVDGEKFSQVKNSVKFCGLKKKRCQSRNGYPYLYRPIDLWVYCKVRFIDILSANSKIAKKEKKLMKLRASLDLMDREFDILEKEMIKKLSDINPEKMIPKSLFFEDVQKEVLKKSQAVKKIDNCGVYFLVYNEEIVYVGQSVNVAARITQHLSERLQENGKRFHKACYMPVKRQYLNEVESYFIKYLEPIYNKNRLSISAGYYRDMNVDEKMMEYIGCN